MAAPFPLIVGTPTDSDVLQAPVEAAQSDYAKMPPTSGEQFNAEIRGTASSDLLKKAEQSQFVEHSWWRDYINANATMAGATEQAEYQPTPTMQAAGPEGYNERYAPRDAAGKIIKQIGDQPMPEGLAKTIGKQMADDYQAQTDIERFDASHGFLARNFSPIAIAATFTDPLNVATALLPGFGEEALAARFGGGLLMRLGARAVVGAEAGALQQSVSSGIKVAAADNTLAEFSMRDALKSVLLGAAAGGTLNLGFGGPIDTIRYMRGTLPEQMAARASTRIEAPAVAAADAETNFAAARSAVSQIVTGRPVDVADFFPKPPERPTETMLGQILNHPFLEHVEPAELGLDRREVAKSIAPNMLREFEAAEQQRTSLASQLQDMNAARARGETQANSLIADQIEQTQQQLAGKLSKANRATAEQRLADLQGQLEKVPSEQDFAAAQRQFQDADNAFRDVAARTAPIFQRADETIARASAAKTGERFEDLIQRQNQFMRPDVSGLIDREKAWRDSGIAPGITHDDLVRAINETEAAAAGAAKVPAAPDKPPANWIETARGATTVTGEKPTEGATGTEAPGAVTTPGKEDTYTQAAQIALKEGSVSSSRIQQEFGIGYNEASKLREQLLKDGVIDDAGKFIGVNKSERPQPQTFEEAYPEMVGRDLSEDEKAELMAAHKEVEAAELKEGAYAEAASCLKAG